MRTKTIFGIMKKCLLLTLSLLLGCACLPASAAESQFKSFSQGEYQDADIVSVLPDGSLSYAVDEQSGSTLPDYSLVGYRNGNEEIPDVPVVKTLEPGDLKDHTSLIQNAINAVAKLPLEQRGAILLKAGIYIISDKLQIKASGIVLRGEGQGENGTILYDERTSQETTLSLSGSSSYKKISNTTSNVINDKVAVGTTEIHVSAADAAKYKAGDSVVVTVTPNEAWIKALGVDNLSGTGEPWKPEDYVMDYERTILSVSGNTITLDTSLTMTIDKQYTAATISLIEDDGRITECGIENIRFVSYYDKTITDDENHGWNAISINNCRDCWIQDVTSIYYGYSCVLVGKGATQVTVERCSCLEPISKTEGGYKYSFCINGGSYILMKNCFSDQGRHDFVVQARVAGPNVFYNCLVNNSHNVSEPHHRWGTGTLYDNVYQIGTIRLGYFEAIMRGNSGTGHGWAGVNTVFWNCLSPMTLIRKPQTEQNYAIGSYGLYSKTEFGIKNYEKYFVKPDVSPANYPATQSQSGSPLYGNGYIESWFNPVNPSSLYQAQLSYRLYGDATKDVKPISPILQYPAHDAVVQSSQLTVSGICDINAKRVIIYIDGEKAAECEPMQSGSSVVFSKTLTLTGGYHSVQVSQVIDKYESELNAARTVRINNGDATDIEAPSIDEFLLLIQNQTALENYQRQVTLLQNDVEKYTSSLQSAVDTLIDALRSMEEAIINGDNDALEMGRYTFNFHKNKLTVNTDDADKFRERAVTLNCDAEILEKIEAALAMAESIAPQIDVLIARANREYNAKAVDEMSIEEELAQLKAEEDEPPAPEDPPTQEPSKLKPIHFIVGAVIVMVIAGCALGILFLKKKRRS